MIYFVEQIIYNTILAKLLQLNNVFFANKKNLYSHEKTNKGSPFLFFHRFIHGPHLDSQPRPASFYQRQDGCRLYL